MRKVQNWDNCILDGEDKQDDGFLQQVFEQEYNEKMKQEAEEYFANDEEYERLFVKEYVIDTLENTAEENIFDFEELKKIGLSSLEKLRGMNSIDCTSLCRLSNAHLCALKGKVEMKKTNEKKICVTLFSSANCLACKKVKDTLNKLKSQYPLELNEIKIETQEDRKKHNVYSFPTAIVGGVSIVGSRNESEFIKILDRVCADNWINGK